jgi:putative nucleotidyltransferase with HDIG domain
LATGFPFKASNRSAASQQESAAKGERASTPSLLMLFYALEAIPALAILLFFGPQLSGDIEVLALLIVLTMLAELMPISIYGDTQVTPGDVPLTGIIILFGLPGIAIAAPLTAILGISHHRFDLKRMVHGSALLTIYYSAGAATYAAIADVNPATFHWTMIPAVLSAAIVSFIFNAALVGVENKLRTGQSFRDFWDKHSWLAPNFVTLALIGLGLTAAYLALGIAGILAFVAPALMIRLSMKQYVDKTKESVVKLELQNDALRTANIEVRRVSEELRTSYDGTLEALVNALDARDQETKGHSIRVSHYMMDIAREVGVKEGTPEWIDMQRGSLLHDVGKIGVSDSILLKPGKLTDDEWTLMRKHPDIGYNMLRQVKFLQGPAEIILAHHERWDGKGYPKGLHEDEILLGGRIFTVVDTFDSMTSDRPYRKALSTLEAMKEIMACSGTQFDPMVVEAFLDIYEKWVKDRDVLHNETEIDLNLSRTAA